MHAYIIIHIICILINNSNISVFFFFFFYIQGIYIHIIWCGIAPAVPGYKSGEYRRHLFSFEEDCMWWQCCWAQNAWHCHPLQRRLSLREHCKSATTEETSQNERVRVCRGRQCFWKLSGSCCTIRWCRQRKMQVSFNIICIEYSNSRETGVTITNTQTHTHTAGHTHTNVLGRKHNMNKCNIYDDVVARLFFFHFVVFFFLLYYF